MKIFILLLTYHKTRFNICSGDYILIYAQVVLSAIKFTLDVGLPRIVMDIGFKELHALLLSEDPCFATVGTIVDDILLSFLL